MSADRSDASPSPPNVRLGLVLFVCCAGQFLVVLDASVVNVALPSIKEALRFDTESLQWVINAYTITFAGFLLLGGRLADLFGRRAAFLGGLAVFTVTSLIGGLATNAATLLTARAIQGLGAAVLAPATLTVIFTSFTDSKQRAKAFGMWSAVAAAGGAVGVLLGGAITEWISWRWILLINVPVGVVLIVCVLRAVTEVRNPGAQSRVDTPGAVTITLGLVALAYGLVLSLDEGWGSGTVLGVLAAAVVLLGLFMLNEAKLAAHPLVPLSVFRNRSVSAGNIVALTSSAALWGTFYLFTLLLQLGLGYSPLHTGLAYLPLAVGMFVAARGIAGHIGRFGARSILLVGLALSAVGLVWLSFADAEADFAVDLFGPTLLLGVGQGLVSASMTVAATTGVPGQQAGLVSGLLNTSRQVGGALGLAALAVVAASHSGADATSPAALVDGYGAAFLVSAAFPVVGLLAALAVPRPPREETAAPAPAERAPAKG
ncbi:MFS transporter [Streptomyces sp. SCSIO 75703]|uniref:MFS transporter n=1 Tax=unclassified Streptomyces TaxID=2593676 RepID=UPI000568FBA9|nr:MULTISPECIES: MFS transporter [unclassified Streptomyces]